MTTDTKETVVKQDAPNVEQDVIKLIPDKVALEAVEKQRKYNPLDNLPPGAGFKPGQSGNPAGRPPKQETLVSCIKSELEKLQPDGRTNQQHIADALVKKARQGDFQAAKLALEYTFGRPVQPIVGQLESRSELVVTWGSRPVSNDNHDKAGSV